MTENNSLVIEAGSDPQSLSYTPDAPEPKAPEPKPLSSREALEKAADELEANGTKFGNDPDDKVEAKPEPKREGGKFAKAEPVEAKAEPTEQDQNPEANAEGEETGQEVETKDRSSEDRDIDKPPARFLPRAKEKWAGVDPDVRGEVYRAISEMEKGMGEYKESHEFRKQLKQYEDMAVEAGIDLPKAVKNYVELDNLVSSNPVAGVERILANQGIRLVDFAQHVLGQAQAEQANPALAQNRQMEQRMQQLERELQEAKQTTQQTQQQTAYQQVEQTVIAPFKDANPRYEELQDDIYFFLNSGKIPSTLSAQQRLAEAYDMAERLNPVSQIQQNTGRLNTATPERPINPAGAKSIKGAPNGTSVPKSANLQSREAIEAAMRQIGL